MVSALEKVNATSVQKGELLSCLLGEVQLQIISQKNHSISKPIVTKIAVLVEIIVLCLYNVGTLKIMNLRCLFCLFCCDYCQIDSFQGLMFRSIGFLQANIVFILDS